MSSQELEEGEITEDTSPIRDCDQENQCENSGLEARLSAPSQGLGALSAVLDSNDSYVKSDTNNSIARAGSSDLFVPSPVIVLPFLDRDERLENFSINPTSNITPIFQADSSLRLVQPTNAVTHGIRIPAHTSLTSHGARSDGVLPVFNFPFSTPIVPLPSTNKNQTFQDVDLRLNTVRPPFTQPIPTLHSRNKVYSFRVKRSSQAKSMHNNQRHFAKYRSLQHSVHPAFRSPPEQKFRGATQPSNPHKMKFGSKETWKSIENLDKNASYEDLLEQHKRIQQELNYLKTEENTKVSRHSPLSKKRRDCRHRRKSRSPRVGKEVSTHEQGKSKSNSPANSKVKKKSPISSQSKENVPELPPVIEIKDDKKDDEFDDDIMELRRMALESRAQLAMKENAIHDNKRNVSDLMPNSDKVLPDNYESVDMDLCSDVPDTHLSEIEMDTEGTGTGNESDKDEDLDLLREKLIKALEAKKKDPVKDNLVESPKNENSNEVPKNNPSISNNKITLPQEKVGEKSDSTSQNTIYQSMDFQPKLSSLDNDVSTDSKTESLKNVAVIQMKKFPKLVINLGEDTSSSEEELEQAEDDGKNNFVSVLDTFLREAKEKSETVPPKTPTAVSQLSKAQQLEYRKLKEELVRRKLVKNGSSQNSEKHSQETELIAQKAADDLERKQKQTKLALFEENLKKERTILAAEGRKSFILNQAAVKKAETYRLEELKVKQLKQQLAAAEKSASDTRDSLKTLRAMIDGIKLSVVKRKTKIANIEKECMQIGKVILGPDYKVPTAIGKVVVSRRKSNSTSNNSASKISASETGAIQSKLSTNELRKKSENQEKIEYYQKLEQQLAQRIQEFRKQDLGTNAKLKTSETLRLVPSLSPISSVNTVMEDKNTSKRKDTISALNSKPNNSVNDRVNVKEGIAVKLHSKTAPADSVADVSDCAKTDITTLDMDVGNTEVSSESPQLILNKDDPVQVPKLNTIHRKTEQKNKNDFNGDASEILNLPHPNLVTKVVPNSPFKSLTCELTSERDIANKDLLDLSLQSENISNKSAQLFNISKITRTRKRKNSSEGVDDVKFDGEFISFNLLSGGKPRKMRKVQNCPLLEDTDSKSTIDFPYKSCLEHFRAYRWSPHHDVEFSSASYLNSINPRDKVCKYSITGNCCDPNCTYQHLPSSPQQLFRHLDIFKDIISYFPEIAGIEKGCSKATAESKIVKLFNSEKQKLKKAKNSNNGKYEVFNRVLDIIKGKLNSKSPYFASEVWCRKYFFDAPHLGNKSNKPAKLCNFEIQCSPLANKQTVDTSWIDDGPVSLFHQSTLVDKRYFEIKNEENPLALEERVKKEPTDVNAWLCLAKMYYNKTNESSQNRLNEALDTMSRALEANQENLQLWKLYLTLYIQHPDSVNDIENMFEQALEYVNHYSIWWNYFMIASTFEKKYDICIKILNHLSEQKSTPEISRQLLEIFLNLLQLNLLVKKDDHVLFHLKTALSRLPQTVEENLSCKSEKPVFKPFTHLLTVKDKVLLWLIYVYYFIFKTLPPILFEQKSTYLGHLIVKEPFLICFPRLPSTLSDVLKLMDDAVQYCVVDKTEQTLNDCVTLYTNWTQLQILNQNFSGAISELKCILQECPKLDKFWIILSNFYGTSERFADAEDALQSGLKHLQQSTKLMEVIATFYVQTNRTSEAVIFLENSVKRYFEPLDIGNRVDCIYLFQTLLKYFPVNDSMPLVSLKRIPGKDLTDEDKGNFWVCYVILLQCKNYTFDDIKAAYESALISVKSLDSKKFLWEHYFQTTMTSFSNFSSAKTIIHRCFQNISFENSLDYLDKETCYDYTFHNCLIETFCNSIDDLSVQADTLQEFLAAAPNNYQLFMRLISILTELKENTQCFNLLSGLLEQSSGIPELWMIYIDLALEHTTEEKVHFLYKQALGFFPMCVDLWIRYIDFEKAQNHQNHVDAALERFHNGLKLSFPQ